MITKNKINKYLSFYQKKVSAPPTQAKFYLQQMETIIKKFPIKKGTAVEPHPNVHTYKTCTESPGKLPKSGWEDSKRQRVTLYLLVQSLSKPFKSQQHECLKVS